MLVLNLPSFDHKIRLFKGQEQIFDKIRKKYVRLTPEEWVRQHFVQYLITNKKYPASLINIERSLTLNNLSKRTDIVVFNNVGKIFMIVECKAPNVAITQKVFEQIAQYNLIKQAKFLTVTNGIEHYCCQIDYDNKSYNFLTDIPDFS